MMVNFMAIAGYPSTIYLSIFHGYTVINYLIQLDGDIHGYSRISETLYTYSFFLVYPGNMQTTAFIPLYPGNSPSLTYRVYLSLYIQEK